MIWIGVPNESSPPYILTVTSLSGFVVWSQQNNSLPASGLIPVSLAPSLFSTGLSYTIALQVMIPYSPGFSAPQTSTTTFAVVQALASMLLKSYSFQNSTVQTKIVLEDSNSNPLTGVRLGLFMVQGNSSLQITTEKTDMLGRASFNVGESLSGGSYLIQVRVLDSNAVFATPVQLPSMTVDSLPTVLTAWNSTSGMPEAMLLRVDDNSPVQGRLVMLEQQLNDGNWSITTTTYTDANGIASFPMTTPSGAWHAIFGGDGFYSSSGSDGASISPSSQSNTLTSQIMPQSSMFSSNTFSNGHIVLKIGESASTIYDSQGQKALGQLSWQVQFKDSAGAWQALAWDGPPSLGMDDPAGYHRVTLDGTAGNGQVAVSMSFVAKPHDVLFTPLRMPVDVQALRGSYTYRMIWRVDGVSASFLQFERRTGDQRAIVRGPLTVGAQTNQSPAGENSVVALAADGKTILFGLNWNSALRYYEGTSLGSGSSGPATSVQFGDVALSQGKHWIIPACPCPDGGGGGGGTGTVVTTTTTMLPSSAYATVPAILSARVQDLNGNPVAGGYVWWVDNGTKVLGNANTNSTGYATMVWTAGAAASQNINANFAGNSVYANSYGSVRTLSVQKTPTAIQVLKPQQIAYSWDLYNYYRSCCNSYGLPIAVPVNIFALAASNHTSPANIYMPAYSGTSSAPPHISGYGWAGLNLTSAVTVTMNGTYTQTQNMNWTRNFYLPPCRNPPNCSTTPRTAHMYLTASLAPPSTLYSPSSTTLNIPYQAVNSVSTSNSKVLQSATPPAHLYVNVNASYPYLSVTMQGLPVSLATYNAYLAYTIGPPTSSFLSGGYTYYALPANTDFAYICTDSTCNTPAANIAVYLYDLNRVYCGIYSTTNNRGIAYIVGNGSNCGYAYAYAAIYTSGNTLTLSELFHIEAVSNPSPFLTNFQGYNYAVYAPQKTGRYLLDMRTFFLNSAYTVIYPNASYPDVQYPYNSCCDIFLTVQKHALEAQSSFNPATTTILNKTNATIQIEDLATSKPLSNASFNYTLTRSTPNPGTILSGSMTTNVNGTTVISLGLLSYGNYTLVVSRSTTSTLNALSANFNITVYKALPTLVLRDVSALQTANPSVVKFLDPSGTSTIPSIVLSQSSPYQFYAILGTSTDLLSLPPGGTASCVANPSKNCVIIGITYGSNAQCAQNGCLNGHQGQVVNAQWVNGQPTGPVACAQTSFNNCSQAVTRLTGTSNVCGTSYCYKFSVFVGSINAVQSYWLFMGVYVYDSSATETDSSGFGYVASPYGFFLVNGIRERPADGSTPLGGSVSFQLNETNSPNSLTAATMTITNSTTSTTKNICLIGGSGCLQPARTTTGSFILYSPNTLVFTPGAYTVTVDMTCPTCGQTTIQILNLVLIISQSSWSENGFVASPYTYETSLINNATGTQLSVGGLTENIYINGIPYATLQTDSNGNAAFIWIPQAAGQYTIKTVFPGQNFYTNSSTTIIVSVAKRNVVLAANNSPQSPSVNQQVTWNVYAQDMMSNSSIVSLPISLFINGVNTTTVNTNSAGNAVFQPPSSTFGSKGSYNITFVSATNSVYSSATIYDPLMVYLGTTLTVQGGTITLGQNATITVVLKDANGNPLPSDRTIQIQINGAFYQNVTTNSNGQAQFIWRPDNTGSYGITANFNANGSGDTGYKSSSNTLTVNVAPKFVTNTATSGVTQSVSLSTAQGSLQPPGVSFSVSFPSWNSVIVNLQFGSVSLQGTLSVSNNFGVNCAAKVFGGCVFLLPYWNAIINVNVGNSQAQVNMPILSLSLPSISFATQGQSQASTNLPAFFLGLFAGEAALGALLLPLAFARDPVSASTAAAILLVGVGALLPLVYLGAFAFANKSDRFAYAFGVLLASAFEAGQAEVVSLFAGIMGSTVWPQVRGAIGMAEGFALMWGILFTSLFYELPG